MVNKNNSIQWNEHIQEFVTVLKEAQRLGLDFEIGRAYISKAYIDKQEALNKKITDLVKLANTIEIKEKEQDALKRDEQFSQNIAENIALKKSSCSYVNIMDERKYDGIVLGVTLHHIVLSLGPSALIIRQKDIDRIPQTGEYIVVKFVGGKGLVEPEEPVKTKGLER